MLATVTPQRAAALLREEHDAVRRLIDELDAEEMTRPDTVHHGFYADQHCSFKDLLAHLITYEALSLEALQAWQRGEAHPVNAIMRSPTRSRELHYGGIEARRGHSLEQVLAEWERCQAALVAAIDALGEEEWRSAPSWPTSEAQDLGGTLQEILVTPPRPLYRHLPVHVPDSAAYIRSLRRGPR